MSFVDVVLLPAAAIVVAVLAWLMFRHFMLKRRCEEKFRDVYGAWKPTPTFTMSYSHGLPSFSVLFKTKPEIEAAASAGLNASFVQGIQELCNSRGSKNRPFQAELAVFISYSGYRDEVMNRTKLTREDIGLR